MLLTEEIHNAYQEKAFSKPANKSCVALHKEVSTLHLSGARHARLGTHLISFT